MYVNNFFFILFNFNMIDFWFKSLFNMFYIISCHFSIKNLLQIVLFRRIKFNFYKFPIIFFYFGQLLGVIRICEGFYIIKICHNMREIINSTVFQLRVIIFRYFLLSNCRLSKTKTKILARELTMLRAKRETR